MPYPTTNSRHPAFRFYILDREEAVNGCFSVAILLPDEPRLAYPTIFHSQPIWNSIREMFGLSDSTFEEMGRGEILSQSNLNPFVRMAELEGTYSPYSIPSCGERDCPACRTRIETEAECRERLIASNVYTTPWECERCGDRDVRALSRRTLAGEDLCADCFSDAMDEDDFNNEDDFDDTRLAPHDFRPDLAFYDVDKTGQIATVPVSEVVYNPETTQAPVQHVKARYRADREYTRNTSLFIGLELEIEGEGRGGPANIQDTVRTMGAQGYCKSDGSLSGDGVEWVTQPHTLAAWRFVHPKMAEGLKKMRSAGHRSLNTDTCGLHMHLSRQSFNGTTHIFKLMQFIYLNPRFIGKLSQRRGDFEFCSLTDVSVEDLPKKAKAAGTRSFERYSAVNLQNTETVELRFFKGTLAVDGVYRALEFADALVNWTRIIPLEDATKLTAFRGYVTTNKKLYPALAAWLAVAGNVEHDVTA